MKKSEEDWNEYGSVSQIGSISTLTEWEEDDTVKNKNPIGFYEHQTKKTKKKRRRK